MRVRATRLFAISGGGRRLALNVFATAAAAYSMRIPANSNYNGPLINVRRSSDNATLDIGAVTTPDANGNRFLDTTALLAFVGANSGFVTTWYDISGNGFNMTQATPALQPRIVIAGAVNLFNGRPSLRFTDTSQDFLYNANIAGFSSSGDFLISSVFEFLQAAQSYDMIAGWRSSPNSPANGTPLLQGITTVAQIGTHNTDVSAVAIKVDVTTRLERRLATVGRTGGTSGNGGTVTVTATGNSQPSYLTSATQTWASTSTTGFQIGGRQQSGTSYGSKNICEVVCFPTNLSTDARQALERNEGTAFEISIFAGAAAAYSMRIPFGSNYNGPLIRVRRSNDNATLDIGAVSTPDANGNRFIDTAALLAFTGSNSGFITTFYDVSGNGINATQTNAANQARIVNAGVVDTLNGVPAARFLGNGTTGSGYTFTVTASQPNTLVIVYRVNSFVTNSHLTDGSGTNRRLVGFAGTTRQMFAGAVATFGTQATGVSQTWGTVFNSTSSVAVVNGTASGTLNVGTQTMSTQIIGGGQGASGGFDPARGMDGWMQEYLVFNSALTTAQIQSIQRNQGAAYGITVA